MNIAKNEITNWEGYFSYSLENNNEHKVAFKMQLELLNGVITGTTVDEESKGLFNEPITVNGFIEEGFINFVVMYPSDYYFDEELNKWLADPEVDYPGCEYKGWWNTDEKKYSGEWSITVNQFKESSFQLDFITEEINGYWEMKNVKN